MNRTCIGLRSLLKQIRKIAYGAIVVVLCLLSVGLIDPTPAYANTLAPDITSLSVISGVEVGTVRLVGLPMNPGDSLFVAVNSTSQPRPSLDYPVPSNASPYVEGTDISGVDQTTNRYLDVYEEKNNQVTAFHEFNLSSFSSISQLFPGAVYVTSTYVQYDSAAGQWQVVFDYTNSGAPTTIPYGANNINIETPNFRANQPTNFPTGSGSWATTIYPTGSNGTTAGNTEDDWALGPNSTFYGIHSTNIAFHLSLSSVSTVAPGQSVQITGTATNDEGGSVAYVPISLTATSGTVQQGDVVTDSNGNFSFEWVAPETPGSVTFTAQAFQPWLRGVTVTQQIQSTVSALNPWTHIALPSPASLTTSQSTTVTGYVYDSQNQPQSNALVNLFVSSGTLSDNANAITLQTNTAGQFSATYEAPSTTGPVSLTAQLVNTNVVAATSFMVNSTGGSTGSGSTGSGSSGAGSPSNGPPVITTSTLQNGTVGQPYYQTLQAYGLVAGDTWNLSGTGSLPQGLSLSSNGIISGLPTAAGNSSFSVTVTSSVYGSSNPQTMAVDILPAPSNGGGGTTNVINGPPVITTSTLPNGTVGQFYSQSLQANGLAAGDTWNLAKGSLPQGLALSSNGIISGLPTVTGNSPFSMTVTSSVYGSSNPQSMAIDIQPAPSSGGGGSTTVIHPVYVTYAAQTLATLDMSTAGGDFVYHGGNVTYQLVAPSGSFSEGSLITLDTPGSNVIQGVQSQLADGKAALLYFSIQYSGQSPSLPSILTVTDGNIPVGAKVYAVSSDGTLTTVNAEVTQGKIQIPVPETSNFVVAAPITSEKPILLRSDERIIAWQGEITIVPVLVRNKTTYMPVYYLMRWLNSMGVQSTWNGHDWNLSSKAAVDLSNIQVGTGSASIYLNKTLVQNTNVLVQADPSTNKPTTYMPIGYVMQLLKRLGLQSSWNGTTWTVTQQS